MDKENRERDNEIKKIEEKLRSEGFRFCGRFTDGYKWSKLVQMDERIFFQRYKTIVYDFTIYTADKKELENFEAWVKEFWGDLDQTFSKKEKEKERKLLYCNCNFPKIVKRGFSHVVYDFCTMCKKEVLKEF